jgi:hypothetical protein
MCEAEGVRYTLAQYSQFVDDRRFDDLADLFTADASWTVLDTTHHGRRSIRDYMSTWEPHGSQVKHLTMNPIIDISGNSATAVSDYIVVYETPNGGVVLRAGRYHDELSKDGDRWRFAQRTHVGTSWIPDWQPPHS